MASLSKMVAKQMEDKLLRVDNMAKILHYKGLCEEQCIKFHKMTLNNSQEDRRVYQLAPGYELDTLFSIV